MAPVPRNSCCAPEVSSPPICAHPNPGLLDWKTAALVPEMTSAPSTYSFHALPSVSNPNTT